MTTEDILQQLRTILNGISGLPQVASMEPKWPQYVSELPAMFLVFNGSTDGYTGSDLRRLHPTTRRETYKVIVYVGGRDLALSVARRKDSVYAAIKTAKLANTLSFNFYASECTVTYSEDAKWASLEIDITVENPTDP